MPMRRLAEGIDKFDDWFGMFSVLGLQLPVYEALRYQCMRP